MTNNIIIGRQAAAHACSAKNCVVIGNNALADKLDLGSNLFHVEGVISTRVDSPHWEAEVAEAQDACMFVGVPAALEPLVELVGADADAVRRVLVHTLHSCRRT
jgi:copper(I)-binding protein